MFRPVWWGARLFWHTNDLKGQRLRLSQTQNYTTTVEEEKAKGASLITVTWRVRARWERRARLNGSILHLVRLFVAIDSRRREKIWESLCKNANDKSNPILTCKKKAVSYALLVSSKAKMSKLGFWSGWWWSGEWRAVNPSIIWEYCHSAFQEGGDISLPPFIYINAFLLHSSNRLKTTTVRHHNNNTARLWPTFFGNFVCDLKQRRCSTTTTRPREDGGRLFVAILCRYRIRDNMPGQDWGFRVFKDFLARCYYWCCVENTNLMKNLAMWFARKCGRNSQQ